MGAQPHMPNDSAPWAQGYVSDVLYTDNFFREFGPAQLNYVAMLNNLEARPLSDGFTYCELGCGRGQTINVMAAANPHGRFYACDFNPTHVAAARKLAEAGKLTNITVLERNFAEMTAEALPDFDFIALHGVWSWISAENRRHIVDFAYRRLKPGGLFYVSYNALPGWAASAPLRQLMLAAGEPVPGDSLAKAKAGLGVLKDLRDAKGAYFTANAAVGPFLERIEKLPINYVVHEYMNRDWMPFYSNEVARDLAPAKLRFAGSATLLENHRAILVTKPMAELLARQPSRELAELTQDFLVNQRFRRDVFVRGGSAAPPALAQKQMRELPFGLLRPASTIAYKGKGPISEFTFGGTAAQAVADALADGPQTIERLTARLQPAGVSAGQVHQMITLLTATGQVAPCARAAQRPPGKIGRRFAVASPFNRLILEEGLENPDHGSLASPLLGNGLPVDVIDRLFMRTLLADPGADAPAAIWAALERRGIALKHDGQALTGAEANTAELRRRFEQFESKILPFLAALDIVQPA